MSRPWKITLALVLLLACGVGWFLFQLFGPSPPIVVSRETTYITEPLADDGLPDYAGYLLAKGREGVTVENNAAVPLLRATWPANMVPDQQRVICEELGIAMPTEEGLASPYSDKQLQQELREWVEQQLPPAPPAKELSAEGDDENYDEFAAGAFYEDEEDEIDYVDQLLGAAESRPWQRSDCPLLADWIDRHAAQFDLLHEAAERPKYYCPSPSMLLTPHNEWTSFLLPVVQSVRSDAARPLQFRALLHLGEGRAADAWADCRVIYSLGRHLDHTTVVGELVAIQVETRANKLALAILDSPHLTEPIAREMLNFLRTHPARDTMIEVLDHGERFHSLTILLLMSGQRTPDSTESTFSEGDDDFISSLSLDWSLILRIYNQWHTRMVDTMKAPTWEEREEAYSVVSNDFPDVDFVESEVQKVVFMGRERRSRWVAESIALMFLPAYKQATSTEDRANTYLQLHTVAAALAVYRLEHNDYPDSLDALVPDLLDSPPVDLFHQNPLVYRRTDDGYLLYSLGANGTDDGGSNESANVHEGYSIAGNEPEPTGPINLQAPLEADDWGIRLPLPKLPFPVFE